MQHHLGVWNDGGERDSEAGIGGLPPYLQNRGLKTFWIIVSLCLYNNMVQKAFLVVMKNDLVS